MNVDEMQTEFNRLTQVAEQAMEHLSVLGVMLLCARAREDNPAAHTLILAVSDQGAWMSVEEVLDADGEELTDLDYIDEGEASNLYTEGWGTAWQAMGTELENTRHDLRYSFDINTVLEGQ